MDSRPLPRQPDDLPETLRLEFEQIEADL